MSLDPYAEWDAAYVLGSLSPADRREFERHLTGCETCSSAVAELAGIPGLLAKVSSAEISPLVDSVAETSLPVPSTLLPRLVRSVERRRRRSRGFVAGAIVAAAAAAAAIVLAIPLVFPSGLTGESRATTVSLSRVVPTALRASIRLVPEGWGTRIEMNCRYDLSGSGGPYDPSARTSYAVFVTDAGGTSTQVATWTAQPGSVVEPSGTTSLALRDIHSIDIRSISDGTVLLAGKP